MTKKRMIALLSAIGVVVVALIVILIVSLTGNKNPSNPTDSSAITDPSQTEPVKEAFDPRSLKKENEVYVIPGNDGVYTVYTCEGDAVVNADLYIDCGTYEDAEKMRKLNQQVIDTKKEEATYTKVTVRDRFFVGTMKPADLASTGLDKKALDMLDKAIEQSEVTTAQ